MTAPGHPVLVGKTHSAVLAVMHEASFPQQEQWSTAAFATQLSHPGVFALAADGGGFVLARASADEAEILTIAVVPAARRRGLGRLLVNGAVDHAAGLGAVAVFLEVAEANAPARALYDRLGFREIGRRRGYYASGEAALVLRLDINPCAATTA